MPDNYEFEVYVPLISKPGEYHNMRCSNQFYSHISMAEQAGIEYIEEYVEDAKTVILSIATMVPMDITESHAMTCAWHEEQLK